MVNGGCASCYRGCQSRVERKLRLLLFTIHHSPFTAFSSVGGEGAARRVAVALRVLGLDGDFARAAGRVDLELEEAVACGQRFPARAADGVAGLRAAADEI